MPWNRPVMTRLLSAVMLAGVGGLLLLSSQWARAEAPRIQATPASLEMMQLLRDEHQLIAEMVKAQLANERTELPRQTTVSSTDLDPASMAAAHSHGDRHAPTARSRRTS